jgi:glycosyltransferase involved in cell wall biosynthesis
VAAPSNADITVVVACFDYGAYLREAIASLSVQEGGAPRIIVVDDGSTDPQTHAVLADLEADGVRVVRQENRGVCAARNAGLRLAATPYALVLDADDRLAPGALATMREPLDRDTALGFSYGFMRLFGDMSGTIRFPGYDPYRLLYRHTIGLSALMRTEVFAATGGFDAGFDHYEDWELWVNALAHGFEGTRVDAVTLEYRRHGGTKLRSDRRCYRQAWRRLRRKHAALYADPGIARRSTLGPAQRLVHRWFWGPRPVPAGIELGLHRALWRPRAEL